MQAFMEGRGWARCTPSLPPTPAPKRPPPRPAPRGAPPPAAKRNPYADVALETLPGGVPNTATRRLMLRIKHAQALPQLASLYRRNRVIPAVWAPRHAAAILMRITRLLYYRSASGIWAADERTARDLAGLMEILAPDLGDARVVRLLEGPRIAQLLVVVARCGVPAPEHLIDPLAQELLRAGAMKLPGDTPHLLAELASALADLGWRERPLWLAIATAAKALLPPPPSMLPGGTAHYSGAADSSGGSGALAACAFQGRDLGLLASAVARAGLNDSDLLDSIAAAAVPRLPLLALSDLAVLGDAFAALGHMAVSGGSSGGDNGTAGQTVGSVDLGEALAAAVVQRLSPASSSGDSGSGDTGSSGEEGSKGAASEASGSSSGASQDSSGAWWQSAAAQLQQSGQGGAGAAIAAAATDASSSDSSSVLWSSGRGAAELDAAIACLDALSALGAPTRDAARAVISSALVQGGARLSPPQLASLLSACAAAGYRSPRVLRKLGRAVCAAPAEEWRAADAAAVARALGDLRRWDPDALSALAVAALEATGHRSGSRGSGRRGGAKGRAAQATTAEEAAAAGALADVVWGCGAAVSGGRGSSGRTPPVPPAVVLLCAAAAAAAERAAAPPETTALTTAGLNPGSASGARMGRMGSSMVPMLTPKQQGDLVWGLKRLGQTELARRVVEAQAAGAAARGAALLVGQEDGPPVF